MTEIKDIESQIDGLKFRITNAVSRCLGTVFLIDVSKLPQKIDIEQAMRDLKSMPFTFSKSDDKSPIEEIDLSIDPEYLYELLKQLKALQDKRREIFKEAIEKHISKNNS